MKATYFPLTFVDKYSQILGKQAHEFFEISQQKIGKSLWVNSLKIKPEKLRRKLEKQGWKLKEMKFHPNAFRIVKGPEKPGQYMGFREGLFNLQEIGSMLPAIVLNPKPGARVLDATAAPGNKTLQLACLMKGKGKLGAVEKNRKRFKSLKFNVTKWGLDGFTKVFESDFLKANFSEGFDFVLLDAPCSSEGVVRKKRDALKNWSGELVKRKAKLQKKLIVKAFDQLKEKGEMVYSVCSLSPEECEEVVQYLIKKRKSAVLEGIKIPGIKTREGIEEWNGKRFDPEIGKCARVWPQDNDTQAFFIAKIKKCQLHSKL